MVFKEIKTTQEFEYLILNTNVDLVVAYFTASWCGPCKQIYPYILNIGENNDHIMALKIDIDLCEELSSKYEISCMPTFKFFKNKNLAECKSFSGADSTKLIDVIKTLLGSNENGSNENGANGHGSNENGSNENGSNENGANENINVGYLNTIDNNPQNNTFNSNNIRGISGFSNFNNGFDNFSNF
jgi:thiol-disulfide isomerase/thioredoxin